jgi:hypothetical protein
MLGLKFRLLFGTLRRFIIDYYHLKKFENDLTKLPKQSALINKVLSIHHKIIYEKTEGYVFSGPFAGMYIPDSISDMYSLQILLGSYERELHPLINEIIADPPKMIVDIGSAQGYYLVGFSMMCKDCSLLGYEMVDEYREISMRLAASNNVKNLITFKGKCTLAELINDIPVNAFVLCDCEGQEIDLLDPVLVPSLKSALICCEVHEFFSPGVTKILVERFKSSHSISFIDEGSRSVNDYRMLFGVPEYISKFLISESRFIDGGRMTSMRFMIFRPNFTIDT